MLEERLINDSLIIAPQAMTNSATVTANLDTKGANYATIRVCLASEINTNAVGPTLSLKHSDDTVVTNFATVVADQTAVDLTDFSVDQVKPGMLVEVIGPNNPVDDVAACADTIGYEFLTGLSRRFERRYIGGGGDC